MIKYLFIIIVVLGFILIKKKASKILEHIEKQSYLVLFLIAFWPLMNFSFSYLLLIVSSVYVVYSLPKWQNNHRKTQQVHLMKYEFPIWLRQLQVLLQNNNVLHALKISYDFAPILIKDELAALIDKLSIDAINAKAFSEFLQDYEIYEIQKVMKLLFRYHTLGNKESYHQLHKMLEITGKWLRSERIKRQETKLAFLTWIGMIPLLAVTLLFMVMMIQIIDKMMKGGM